VSCHLRLRDLALRDSSRVGLTPVFKGQMAPILRGWMRRRQKLMATAALVSSSALSCSRSSNKGLSSWVSSVASWLVHSGPTTGIYPVLDLSAGAGLLR
jgi:hypothetical protein